MLLARSLSTTLLAAPPLGSACGILGVKIDADLLRGFGDFFAA